MYTFIFILLYYVPFTLCFFSTYAHAAKFRVKDLKDLSGMILHMGFARCTGFLTGGRGAILISTLELFLHFLLMNAYIDKYYI